MKKINQFILLLVLIAAIPFISSCSDDDDANEWQMSYVSLLPVDYLRPIPSFTLSHVEDEGVEGSVEFEFVAMADKTADRDITVTLDIACEGISADKIITSSKSVIIKAGTAKSGIVTVKITDWSDIAGITAESKHTLKINIAAIESDASGVVNSDYRQDISMLITKKKESPAEGTLYNNVADWNFTFMNGVENSNSNTVAGTGGSDVATNGIPFWVTVDFRSVRNLTGIRTGHWAAGYAPTKVELFVSDDNATWTSIGVMATAGKTQEIKFGKRVATRYFKYQMITVPSRVNLMTFAIYATN